MIVLSWYRFRRLRSRLVMHGGFGWRKLSPYLTLIPILRRVYFSRSSCCFIRNKPCSVNIHAIIQICYSKTLHNMVFLKLEINDRENETVAFNFEVFPLGQKQEQFKYETNVLAWHHRSYER